jgi:3-methyladenine DNA glycosylase AlkD
MPTVVNQILRELQQLGDAKTRDVGRGFFKETIKLYGVKTPVVRRMGKAYFQGLPDKSRVRVWPLCTALWQSGQLEAAVIACDWSYALRRDYRPADFKVFEKWLAAYVRNWAACDTLCNHTLGAFLEKYPAYLEKLKTWAKSPNRWLRRAAAVSLIVPAKAGKFLPVVFGIADLLLEDADDLVQKGYGWMLKVAANRHEAEVFNYIMRNQARLPRTALRYAIEKMPADLKRRAMAK